MRSPGNPASAGCGGFEGDLFEHALEKRGETTGTDVFGFLVHTECNLGQAFDSVIRELNAQIERGRDHDLRR